jgi:hypothetical protein
LHARHVPWEDTPVDTTMAHQTEWEIFRKNDLETLWILDRTNNKLYEVGGDVPKEQEAGQMAYADAVRLNRILGRRLGTWKFRHVIDMGGKRIAHLHVCVSPQGNIQDVGAEGFHTSVAWLTGLSGLCQSCIDTTTASKQKQRSIGEYIERETRTL